MESRWYALHSKPYKEEALWRHVLAQGFEAFYPSLRVKPVNPRSRTRRPFYPGYLFVRADLQITGERTFQRMPHAAGLVCFGGIPASIPDALVSGIRRRVEELGAEPQPKGSGLCPGDRVVITDGLLAGYKGIVDSALSGSERVRILLQLIGGRAVRLELARDTVGPQEPA
jgi:transcriptional antiterminator RfaH